MKKLVVCAGSGGYGLKNEMVKYLAEKKVDFEDISTKDGEEAYFLAAKRACEKIQNGEYEKGLLFCGSGMGVAIVANKFKGIYASCVESVFAAEKCRVINDSNVLCLGNNIWGAPMAREAVDAFLETEFTQGTSAQLEEILKDALCEIKKIEDENYK